MSISERLLQYLEYKGITRAAFYKATGLANGYLDKKPNIGADKIERIIYAYTDISLNWLITGQGEMILNEENISESGRILKPIEIIGKLVQQNETLITIIDRHSSIIEKLSSKFEGH